MLDDGDHALEAQEGLTRASTPPSPPSPGAGARLALALAVLCGSGFSLALGLQSLLIRRATPAFFASNTLGVPGRTRLLIWLLVGGCLPLLGAATYLVRQRQTRVPRLCKLAELVCPLLLSGFVPALFVWQFGQKATLSYLFFLVLVVMCSLYLWGVSLRAWSEQTPPPSIAALYAAIASWGARQSRWLGLTLVLVAASGYALYTGYYSLHQHRLLQTFALDLGIYDNLMYGALHGRPFQSPVLFGPGHHSYLAGHAEYGMLLFLPIYALRPGAETLLVLQSVVLGFAALPLFLFARTRLPQAIAVLLAVGYLLFAPLHGPNFYDFHWLPLAIFFHFWLYFALATRRNWLAIVTLLVLFSMREDIALGLCMLGLFLWLSGERPRFGWVLALVSVVWFGINKFVLMRLAGAWWFENMYAELFADGQPGYGSVLKTLLSNPTYAFVSLAREAKLVYVFHLLAPLAFLPLRRLPLVVLLLPGFFFTLLTTGYWPTTSIAFQYTTHWIPYLFLATALALWLIGREPGGKAARLAAVLTLVLALTSHSYNFGAILQRESFVGGFLPVTFGRQPKEDERYRALMSLVARIPARASVAATELLNPHISARLEAYTFRYNLPAVDYVLLGKSEMNGDPARYLGTLLRKHEYGLVAEAGGEFFLLKRGAESDIDDLAARLGVRLTPRKKRRGGD